MAIPILHTITDLIWQVRKRKFSTAICRKFPVQTGRHIACPANARWMLRNIPTSPLSQLQLRELKDWAKNSLYPEAK